MPHIISRYGNAFFLAYIFGGLFFLLAIETPLNAGLRMTLLWLALPFAAIVFGYTYRYEDYFAAHSKPRWRTRIKARWRVWITAVLVYPMIVFFAWPYLIAANSIPASGERISFAGPILKKWISRGKYYLGYEIVILDETTRVEMTFTVSRAEFQSVKSGEYFRRDFYLGRFGIPYRWKI